MTQSDFDLYTSSRRIAVERGCTFSDLARCLNKHRSTLQTTLKGNPTLRVLRQVSWALKVEPYHLLLPEPQLVQLCSDMAAARTEGVAVTDAPIQLAAIDHKIKRKADRELEPVEVDQEPDKDDTGVPPGYRMSDEALAMEPVYSKWEAIGWTAAKMKQSGYLVPIEEDDQ